MELIRRIKKKIKKKLILKGKKLSRFGLLGTRILNDGSAHFEECQFECYGENNIIKIGCGVDLTTCKIFINGKNNAIHIDDGCYISSATFYLAGNGSEIRIGKGVFANMNNQFTCIDGCKLILGDRCLLSTEINIQVGDGHSIYDENGNRLNVTKDVVIGEHVWIGKGVTILKGVQIASGCVIGTKAIVTNSFTERNTVIVGAPAKVVKRNIRWKK